jgi:phosphatidylserine/phosphatidylglycerophosphate/cardiolipin synthase-like enzyme
VNQNFSSHVVNLINQANVSVDACLYSFSLDNVRDALIDAHLRGCQVRIIIDAGNSSTWAAQCASYGIPYITSTFASNHGSDDGYGSMHNKWIVVDAFDDDANKYNDWVWTGSGNMSISGLDDVNNGLRIRDYGLAQAYTFEFDEMWGVHGPGPHPNSNMGIHKIDNTPHEFTINGIRVEQYMSPSDQVRYQIVKSVESADYSIYFAILAFTDWQITNALEDMTYANPALELRGVFNQDQDCGASSQYFPMAGDPCSDYAWNNPADVWLDTALPSSKLLHHKYVVVDANWGGDDPLVLTGSHNWSYSAENFNDENTLIFHDQTIANMYLQEFANRYHESGGTGLLGEVVGVEDGPHDLSGRLIGSVNSYPNPFNPFTNISFMTAEMARVSVKVYDASGRLVQTLADDDMMEPGLHILAWDGKDARGHRQPSGAYFARVSGGSLSGGLSGDEQAKLILLQ